MLLYSRARIAREILTYQGSCLMSRLSLLQVKQDGLVERFIKTFKQMLKKAMETDGKNWDHILPHEHLAVRKLPQASEWLSPFEVQYGRRPRGVLDLAKDSWASHASRNRTLLGHLEQVRECMPQVWPMVTR